MAHLSRPGLLVVLLALVGSCGNRPAAEATGASLEQLRAREAALVRQSADFEKLVAARQGLRERSAQAALRLPATVDQPGMVAFLQMIANSAGVQLTGLVAQPAVDSGAYVRWPIALEARGSIAAIAALLVALETSRRVFTVEDFALAVAERKKGTVELVARFVVATFAQPEPAHPAATGPGLVRYARIDPKLRRTPAPRDFVERDPFAEPAGAVSAMPASAPPAPDAGQPAATCDRAPYAPATAPATTPAAPTPPPAAGDVEARKVYERILLLQAKLKDYDQLAAATADEDRHLKAVTELLAQSGTPSGLLLELANVLTTEHVPVMTEDMARRLAQEPDRKFARSWDANRLWLETFTETCGAFRLTGAAMAAQDVAQLALRLQASVHFPTVLVQEVTAVDNGVRFTLTGTVAY